jgi:transposase-like protein
MQRVASLPNQRIAGDGPSAGLDATEADVLAEMSFPTAHRGKHRSANPIERLNRGGQTDLRHQESATY